VIGWRCLCAGEVHVSATASSACVGIAAGSPRKSAAASSSSSSAAAAGGLSGVESFTVDFRARWPLSLVLSRKAVAKFQLLFRHLFRCKYVERMLGVQWRTDAGTRDFEALRCVDSLVVVVVVVVVVVLR
jgi:hypothetical protein